MSHEVSETVQDRKTGKWVNVYGRNTKRRGERLPEDPSGAGHREYDTAEEAVEEAKRRSEEHGRRHRKPARGAAYRDLMGDKE